MKRREAGLSILGLTLVAAGLDAVGAAELPATLPNGAAAGDVTATSVVLWARSTALGRMVFEYGTDPTFAVLVGSRTRVVSDAALPVKAILTGLVPGTTYYYRVSDRAGAVVTGTFRTPQRSGKSGLRFGVSGDWRGELAPYPAITNAPGRNLAFFVEHGDTIYSDFPSPALPSEQAVTLAEYRIKHAEVYGERFGVNTWAALRASTAFFATIDDHEVTNDFAGGAPPSSNPLFAPFDVPLVNDTPVFKDALQAFQEYNPMRALVYGETGDPRTAGKPKLYRYRTFGQDAALFVTDARSFRDAPLPAVANPTDPAQIANFLIASLTQTSRTFLGRAQVDELKNDLQRAQNAGITWKFVLVPEPVQNLGVVGAPDRYEGYAAERTELLSFIKDNGIKNVVFVAADIHGTLVNNLTYQTVPFGPQIDSGAFEITTGSVAFAAPFGPTVVEIAAAFGLITPDQLAFYNAQPRAGKDEFVRQLVDGQLVPLGYTPIGLQGSSINATLTTGGYVATHTFGWTEFDIAPDQTLTVTTYGIDFYSEAELNADPTAILARTPEIISQFTVTAQ